MKQSPERSLARQSAFKLSLLFVALVAAGGTARADDTTPQAHPHLTGDWGGLRTKLENAGVDLEFNYTTESAYNAAGGSKNLLTYTDQLALSGDSGLDRLLAIHDAEFKIAFTKRDGENLSRDANLGTLQQVQEVFGRGQTFRLTQLWYDQKYFSGLVDWKLGRLTVGEDFASFSCQFMNLTFCGSQPGNIVGNYWFNWPVSQWASRVKFNLPQDLDLEVGAYEANPHFLDTTDATLPILPSGATGVIVPVELGWSPTIGKDNLAGSYKVGAWYDSSNAPDVSDDVNGDSIALTGLPGKQRSGRYGAYVNFLQQVVRFDPNNDARGVSLFFNATFADKQTSTIDNQFALGTIAKGIFDARPADEIGFAVGRTHVNGHIADDQRRTGAIVQTSEYAFELYYGFQVTDYLVLRPNFQYVKDPGGTSHNDDVVIAGLKTSLDF